MSVSIKGDFSKLARLQAKVKSLATDDVRVRFANVMGAEALTQVQLGFRESRDPFGTSWPALKRRIGKPLLDTGRLRASFSYRPGVRGFEIGTNVQYAKFHQYGAPKRRIPRRMMVPEGRLGPIWSKAFHDTAKRFFSRLLKP